MCVHVFSDVKKKVQIFSRLFRFLHKHTLFQNELSGLNVSVSVCLKNVFSLGSSLIPSNNNITAFCNSGGLKELYASAPFLDSVFRLSWGIFGQS